MSDLPHTDPAEVRKAIALGKKAERFASILSRNMEEGGWGELDAELLKALGSAWDIRPPEGFVLEPEGLANISSLLVLLVQTFSELDGDDGAIHF